MNHINHIQTESIAVALMIIQYSMKPNFFSKIAISVRRLADANYQYYLLNLFDNATHSSNGAGATLIRNLTNISTNQT